MIIVQGAARVHPDQLPALRAAAAAMVTATRAEPGCIVYAFAEDVLEAGLLHIIEQWTDDAALAAHFATPHMAAFNAALGNAQLQSIKAVAYTVAGERVLVGG